MAQQPNIEREDGDLHTEGGRGPERRWAPTRPGEISAPSDVPSGGSFGRPGPDTGWAAKLASNTSYDRGDRPDVLAALLTALVGARAAAAGRGPVPQDVEVALSLVGLRQQDMDSGALAVLADQRERWLDAVAHEPWPGMTALSDIDDSLLAETPAQVRSLLNDSPSLGSQGS